MYNYNFVIQDFGIDKNLSERIMDIENDPALRGSLEKVGLLYDIVTSGLIHFPSSSFTK